MSVAISSAGACAESTLFRRIARTDLTKVNEAAASAR
jgi:hypothetical protein